MDLAVKIVGVVFICMGLLFLLRPGWAKALAKVFRQGKRLYIGGVVRLVVAVLFLLAARECKHPWLIGLFGGAFLLAAMIIFLAGPERLKPMVTWFQERSTVWGRIAGAVTLALGAIIVYAA